MPGRRKRSASSIGGGIGGKRGACMRKLVMLRYGVLRNRTPFDAEWASRMAP